MEGPLFSIHEHRHQNGAGADADHRRAAVGVGRQAICLADAVSDGGALREDQQIVAALNGLDGGFHRLNIRTAPVHGECAPHPDDPCQNGIPEQFLLAHDAKPVIHGQRRGQHQRVPVAGVIRHQQRAVARQVFQALNRDRMQQTADPLGNREDQREKRSEGLRCTGLVHRLVLSRMIRRIASSLCRKSSSVVSSKTASSACFKGAAAR